AFIFKDVLMDVQPNPFFIFKEENKETKQDSEYEEQDEEDSELRKVSKKIKDKKKLNHFTVPRMQYEICNVYIFGSDIVDPTTMIGIMKSPQDAVNKRKRQIDKNADMANGKYVVAGKRVDKNTVQEFTEEPRGILYMEDADSTQGAIDILMGRAFDPGIFSDMQDSKNEVDNIIGIHGTTRGERGIQETAR